MSEATKYIVVTLVLTLAIFLLWLTPWRLGGPTRGDSSGASPEVRAVSGATGKLFQMRKIRTFNHNLLKKTVVGDVKAWKEGKHCPKWVVITTINEPTKTVEQVASLKSWCSVIVLDKKTPTPFVAPGAVVLTVEDQQRLSYRITRSTPWNHFGRKNVGYLYAVAHGAEVIYDCDDDNELIATSPEETAVPIHIEKEVLSTPPGVTAFNPYPAFGNLGGWPRGFPLDQVLNRSSYVLTDRTNVRSLDNFWVHQSLANNDPDYDAIYRLTHPLPVSFQRHAPIAIRPGTMAPYNAQATLHFRRAFWGMLLPITVHGRVSDIWRSYLTQRLLWDVGGRVVFRSPWVVQYRNAHNYLADFDSEYDLYKKTSALISFLQHWSCDGANVTVPECLLRLSVEMFEYGIVDTGDVVLMSAWVQDLRSLGYEFPKMGATEDTATTGG